MKVSTKGDYGLRALVELALRFGQGPLQSAEIAARQGIPEPYLDQLLTNLRRAGFIRSIRGPQGGHALVRPPDELRLSEVMLALEGSLSPIGWLDERDGRRAGCEAQRPVWEAVRDATFKVLDGVTVADLAEYERKRAGNGDRYVI